MSTRETEGAALTPPSSPPTPSLAAADKSRAGRVTHGTGEAYVPLCCKNMPPRQLRAPEHPQSREKCAGGGLGLAHVCDTTYLSNGMFSTTCGSDSSWLKWMSGWA